MDPEKPEIPQDTLPEHNQPGRNNNSDGEQEDLALKSQEKSQEQQPLQFPNLVHSEAANQIQQNKGEKQHENQGQANDKPKTDEVEIKVEKLVMKEGMDSESDRPISAQFGKEALKVEEKTIVIEESSIKIEVTGSQEKGFALNKQTFYQIVGSDNNGPFQIERRFCEFEELRKILLERWPGCFIPNLSEKSEIRSDELRMAHKRKKLESFLKKIAMSEYIYYKEETQIFLRGMGLDMEEMFTKMPVLRVRDVIERFKSAFEDEVEKSSTPENSTYITSFSTCLKKVLQSLGDLSKQSLKLAESYDAYRTSLPKFSGLIANYEQMCLLEYTQNPERLVCMRDTEGIVEKLKVLQENNIFYEFYFMFESEKRDAEALIDIVLSMEMFNIRKDDLEMKSKQTRLEIDQIYLGHKNLKVMTSRKTKEEVIAELEEKEKEMISEKHIISEMSNIAEIVLATKTIPTFKKMKKNNYCRLIKKWVQVTGSVNENVFAVWRFLEKESKDQLKKVIAK